MLICKNTHFAEPIEQLECGTRISLHEIESEVYDQAQCKAIMQEIRTQHITTKGERQDTEDEADMRYERTCFRPVRLLKLYF